MRRRGREKFIENLPLLAGLLLLALVIFVISIISVENKEIRDKYGENSTEYNISQNGQEGIEKTEWWLKKVFNYLIKKINIS